MDIKHTRKHFAKRLDAAIEQLQELRDDIDTYDEGDTWLTIGFESVLDIINKMMEMAEEGSENDADDDVEEVSLDEDDEDDIKDDDYGDSELNFEKEDYDE